MTHSQSLRRIADWVISTKAHHARSKCLDQYLEAGGLPGVCFVRDPKGRINRIEEQLYTILDRDLRSVQPIKLPYRQILDFLSELARVEGEPLNHTLLKSRTGISPVTQKKAALRP